MQNIENRTAFETLIQQNQDTVIAVDFWAPWCGPCQAFGPILEEAASTAGPAAEIVKVNVDTLPEIAKHYQITSIPTVLYFQNGNVAHRATGIEPAATIVARINELSLQQV